MTDEPANSPARNGNADPSPGDPLSPEGRERAARRRRLSRRIRVLFAIALALLGGVLLFFYFKVWRGGARKAEKPPSAQGKPGDGGASVDLEEHRKGMPVRDFIVE